MAESKSGQDPSMEEVLESIRRVVSDGGESGETSDCASEAIGKAESTQCELPQELDATVAEESATDTEEVLELTDAVDDEGNVTGVTGRASAQQVRSISAPTPEDLNPAPSIKITDVQTEPLTSFEVEEKVANAFRKMERNFVTQHANSEKPSVGHGGKTIEEHVLEMLRPMLQEWLDKNLSQIVQRLVQREIDRISHRSDPR